MQISQTLLASHRTLLQQLRKLQALVMHSTGKTAQTSTCIMVNGQTYYFNSPVFTTCAREESSFGVLIIGWVKLDMAGVDRRNCIGDINSLCSIFSSIYPNGVNSGLVP